MNTHKQIPLSQREWDRIVGWGKAQPPRKAKDSDTLDYIPGKNNSLALDHRVSKPL